MNQRLDEFTSVQFVVVVSVVHFEVVELEFLVGHFACINWNVHVFGNMIFLHLKVPCV